jgi:long-subunit acyl-CoA synthetase (AMP-forming)
VTGTGMIEATTFVEGFRRSTETYPDHVAVRTVDDAVSLSYAALYARAERLARGLAALGLHRGETLAIMLANRPEFNVVDLAAVLLGAVPFSIYQTLPPAQIAYVVADSGARVAVVEQTFLKAFLEARAQTPGLTHVVVVDGEAPPGTLPLAEVEAAASAFNVADASRAVQPDDLLTLIYTSGTTGPPKGVQLSHRNLMSVVTSLNQTTQLPVNGRVISWLPTAHIAERAFNYYLPMLMGAAITTCANPRDIIAVLPQVRPHFFFAVPRIWEKLKAGIEARLAGLPAEQAATVRRAIDAARQKVRLEQAGQPVSPEMAAQVAKAEAELFAPLRAMLGLDETSVAGTGAAPTPLEVLEFFHGIGVPLGEGWGMSETCGVGTVNPPGRVKLGTVGRPAPGIEIKLAPDGEILIRGENVMVGYRNQPDKTREVVDAEGWLATGDIGELDAEGYLKIVDRKKELLINAAGKNMSPTNIEGTLKGGSPLIGQACAIGDNRPYNTALVVLDPEYAGAWAAAHGLGDQAFEALATAPAVVAAVQEGIDRANAKLARVEQIKRFTIVPGDWPAGGDELTPTMKLKRKPIAEKYRAEIERMYAG